MGVIGVNTLEKREKRRRRRNKNNNPSSDDSACNSDSSLSASSTTTTRRRRRTRKNKKSGTPNPPSEPEKVILSLEEQMKYVAMDCEMVGVGYRGRKSSVARVTLVGWNGNIIFDEFVKQSV